MTTREKTKLPYLLVFPSLILLGGILYPFFTAVWYSLTNYRLVGRNFSFVGLENYIWIFQDEEFIRSVWITLLYTLIILLFQIPLGIAIAHLLNKEAPGIKLVRGLSIVPMMIPPVIGGLMWKTMMDQNGVLNALLGYIGIDPVRWLSSTSMAFPSIVIIEVWMWLPFVTLILLSGLQSLPQNPYEAATIDGAGPWRSFWYITLPLLRPFLMIVVLFRFIDTLKVFDIVFSTTGGGPVNATKFLQISVYEEAFIGKNMGIAMAKILVLWAITYIGSFFIVRKLFPSSSPKVKAGE